jgi:hypothetical protein
MIKDVITYNAENKKARLRPESHKAHAAKAGVSIEKFSEQPQQPNTEADAEIAQLLASVPDGIEAGIWAMIKASKTPFR